MIFLNQLVQFLAKMKRKKNRTRTFIMKSKTKEKKGLFFSSFDFFRVERVTRYSLKVKSGEIPPFTPHWQTKKPKDEPSKWTAFYAENGNPYQRVYEPRRTKIGERIKNECIEYSKEKH